MAELKNEFAWSFTRQRIFDHCKRLYYYRYYGHWNGWLPNAADEARVCYRLSKMQNLPMLAGSLVHKVIRDLLKRLKSGRVIPLERLLERGARELGLALFQSEQKRWLGDPKRNVNLYEHYYGRQIADETLTDIRARIRDSLTNFYSSSAFAMIRSSDPSGWRSVEDPLNFQLQGFKVALIMDFAADLGTGLEIFDWKTGGADESYDRQLVCYAVSAQQQWGYSLDQIRCHLFYLDENHLREPFQVTEVQRMQTIAEIVRTCELMHRYLLDPANNVAAKEDFPMTDDPDNCGSCFFQQLCYDSPGPMPSRPMHTGDRMVSLTHPTEGQL